MVTKAEPLFRGERRPLGPNALPLMVVASILALIPWLPLIWIAIPLLNGSPRTTETCDDDCFFTPPRQLLGEWLGPSGACVAVAATIAILVARRYGVRAWPTTIVIVAASALGSYAWYLN